MIDLSFQNGAAAFVAGLLSVASPCVLPVIPIVVTGGGKDHKLRPLLVVLGLSFSFVLMGVISSLFGSVITSKMRYVEWVAGVLIAVFGVLMLLDINPFKKLSLFNKMKTNYTGLFSGFLLGATLGLVWIPCIGPMLSGVLAMVATDGQLASGVLLLLIYSAGFSVPMLIAGYFTQFFRTKVRAVSAKGNAVRYISGILLIAFGVFITQGGVLLLSS
jgi:cytochrome c-type biogenesis protein